MRNWVVQIARYLPGAAQRAFRTRQRSEVLPCRMDMFPFARNLLVGKSNPLSLDLNGLRRDAEAMRETGKRPLN